MRFRLPDQAILGGHRLAADLFIREDVENFEPLHTLNPVPSILTLVALRDPLLLGPVCSVPNTCNHIS